MDNATQMEGTHSERKRVVHGTCHLGILHARRRRARRRRRLGAAMRFDRESFEADRARYEGDLATHLGNGLTDGHPLVERARRRIETCTRVLTDPAYGLTEETTGDDHPA